MGFCLFTVSSKKVQYDFLNWCTEENLVVNNKDDRVFVSWNYQSDCCPLGNVLKTGIFALEAKYLFSEHQIFAGQLSADSSKFILKKTDA